MKIFRTFQLFDLIIQSLLLAGVSLPILLAAFKTDYLFWSLIGLFPLGVWQLFSALVLGFGLPDKFRRLYLLTATTFCGLFYSGGYLINQLNLAPYFRSSIDFDIPLYLLFAVLIVSFAAAWYYFSYSYRDYRIGKKHIAL